MMHRLPVEPLPPDKRSFTPRYFIVWPTLSFPMKAKEPIEPTKLHIGSVDHVLCGKTPDKLFGIEITVAIDGVVIIPQNTNRTFFPTQICKSCYAAWEKGRSDV